MKVYNDDLDEMDMPAQEAKEWISTNKNKWCFASNHFETKEHILKFVKDLYKLGALKIEIDNVYAEEWRIKEEKGPYADVLLITLPKAKTKIEQLKIRMNKEFPDEMDRYDGSDYIRRLKWVGGEIVRLWWD